MQKFTTEQRKVVQGLAATDRLVANPSDGLLEGERVEIVHAPPENSDDEAAAPAHPEQSED